MELHYFKTITRKTILIITGVCIAASFVQGQHPNVTINTKEEKAVLQTERELLQAFIQGDTNTLNRLLEDSYRLNGSLTKQAILKEPKPMSNTSFDTSSLKARLFGDSAEVSGILLMKRPGATDIYLQVVDRLVKHPKSWQSIST